MSSVWSIRRSATDKKLAGVCGGVARHWNVDPLLVRIGWVLLALSGGVGVVLYVAAWLLVPADGAATSMMDDLTKGQTSSWPREAWVAIVAVACLVTFFALSSATTVGFGPALVLALIWYFGYYKSKAKRNAQPSQPSTTESAANQSAQRPIGTPPAAEQFRYPGPSTPFTEAAEAWQRRVEDMRRNAGGTPNPTSTPPRPTPASPQPPLTPTAPAWQSYQYGSGPSAVQDPPSPEAVQAAARADFLATPDPVGLYTEVAPVKAATAPSRRAQARSLSARRLRLVGVVVLGLVLLGLAIADSLGVSIAPVVYASAALLVVGLTLVAATWLGRARGILPVGLLLLLVVLGMSVAGPASRFVHEYSYTSTSQFPAQPVSVEHGLVKVDLRNVDVATDATFAADLGTGAIEIQVPADTNVVLDYSVGDGVVMDNDRTVATGNRLHDSTPLVQSRDNEHTLTLDIDVDQGMLAVKR